MWTKRSEVEVYMCDFDFIRKGNYFWEEPGSRTQVEVNMKMRDKE